VTSEKKEDWWYKKEGKIVSPHFELRREFKEKVDRPFWMYQTNRFLEIAKEKLKIEVSQGSIEEANIVAETEIIEEEFTPEILQLLNSPKTNNSNKTLLDLLQSNQKIDRKLREEIRHIPVSENDLTQEIYDKLKIENSYLLNAMKNREMAKKLREIIRKHNDDLRPKKD
jgi:hypothetical protein